MHGVQSSMHTSIHTLNATTVYKFLAQMPSWYVDSVESDVAQLQVYSSNNASVLVREDVITWLEIVTSTPGKSSEGQTTCSEPFTDAGVTNVPNTPCTVH